MGFRQTFACSKRFVTVTQQHRFAKSSTKTWFQWLARYASNQGTNSSLEDNRRTNSTSRNRPNSSREDVSLIRNIGIIAHIDAGKTTTSERMLYYSGFSTHMGDVDRGDTVMDFMDQERERGITINSAAVTFHWNGHKMNLIDTPGHVDFTVEVERSLRVLDGAITVLDSSAGVEAQTLTVWRQADKYCVPSIVYLNKMDKNGASVHLCMESMHEKLGVTPLLLQLPVGAESSFTGLVDLVHMDLLAWDPHTSSDGATFSRKSLSKHEDPSLYEEAHVARGELIGELAEHDPHVAELVLGETMIENISCVELQAAIRRVTLSRTVVPVLCGSSLKNKGIQPLLDSVVSYLPSPQDIHYDFTGHYGTDLCALAFKVSHHKQRGPLTFLRLYSGCLESGSSVFNINQQTTEKINRIMQVYADEHVDISRAVAGNIVAVAGFKQTITGDTITTSQSTAKAANKEWQMDQKRKGKLLKDDSSDSEVDSLPVLAGVSVPTPVFFCSIEPSSLAYQKQLDHALTCLQKEDPSLKVEVNAETGQTILSGMGELHLDIIHSRIHQEYGVSADLGPLQVAYRETITDHTQVVEVLDRTLGEEHHFVRMCMSVRPDGQVQHFKHINIDPADDDSIPHLNQHHLKAIDNGVMSALASGPLLGFPVINVSVSLHQLSMQKGTSLAMVAACAVQCVTKALKQAGPQLLEPMMKLQITTDKNRLHTVLADLSRRRSHILNMTSGQSTEILDAMTPLSEIRGYSTDLRTITSGTATFSMQLSHYEKMTKDDQQTLIKNQLG